jgi:succinate dehydrogenase / fumarate reductase cytochrome b subunit
MPSRARFLDSSVGMKLLIGVTGLGLFIYLIVHIAGNLVVFLGPEVFNRYATTLSGNPLIPVIEVGLLLIFLIHVYKTIRMFLANQVARPVAYAKKRYAGPPSRKTFASATMIVSGLWLLVFVIVHVRTFRFGNVYEWPAGGHDLYRLEMETFADPLTVGFYVVSMLVVGSHLWHGISSSFQSLGIDGPRVTPRLIVAGRAAAALIAGAFIVIALWAHFIGAGS